ncbi:GhoT/OrtT family toxin [Klebsiella pneumoniae]
MMISYQELVRTFLSWFLTKESRMIRLLAALLIGATWPFSFPMALLVSLF